MLEWKLTDLSGTLLSYLDGRKPGAQVKLSVNAQRTAQVTLSLDDKLWRTLDPRDVALATVLRCDMLGVPLFAGVVLTPSFNLSSNTVTLPAVDPWLRLNNFYMGQRSDGAGLINSLANNPWRWENIDQAVMMWNMIQHASPTIDEQSAGVPDHGIVYGYLPVTGTPPVVSTVSRTREYAPGTNIGTALKQLTEVINGCDIDLKPIDDSSRPKALTELWVYYPSMGTSKTGSIVLECNLGAENASDITYMPAGDLARNRSTWVGQVLEGLPQQYATANQPESQKAYGIYADWQSNPDILDLSTLAEHAQGVAAAQSWPPDQFEVIPATDDGTGWQRDAATGNLVRVPDKQFGIPPRFGPGAAGEYWLGDEIMATGRYGSTIIELPGRVIDGTLTELPSGALQTALTCTPTVVQTGVVPSTGLVG